MTTVDVLVQSSIISMGLTSAYLLGLKDTNKNKYGMLIQSIRQIPFIALYCIGKQWLMVAAAVVYGMVWSYSTYKKWPPIEKGLR
jgi:hypothetical protein